MTERRRRSYIVQDQPKLDQTRHINCQSHRVAGRESTSTDSPGRDDNDSRTLDTIASCTAILLLADTQTQTGEKCSVTLNPSETERGEKETK